MELIPALKIGWLNGWLLVCLLYVIYGILLKIFPKDVVARLYDKSGRTKRHKVIILFGSLLVFIYFVLIIFTPLKIGSCIFVLGIIVFMFGLTGFLIALFHFKNAPPDQPITSGLYRISRHPQQLMFFITFIGICFAIGSWIALFIQLISSLFLHTRIVAEEKACLARYGNSYQSYMKHVPRYLIFFLVFLTLLIFSCEQKSEMTSGKFDVAISDSLRTIANNFLKSWEPPFDEENSLNPFTKTSDFALIIDSIYIPDYERWAEVTSNSMQYERENYLSYQHQIEDIRTVVLSKNSGVVSVIYSWEYTKRDKVHYCTPGAITMVCRIEDGKWKIVHYHGSHGGEQLKQQNL